MHERVKHKSPCISIFKPVNNLEMWMPRYINFRATICTLINNVLIYALKTADF